MSRLMLLALLAAGQAGEGLITFVELEAKLRAQPELDADVLAVVPEGAKILVHDRMDSLWMEATYEGRRGFLTKGHLGEIDYATTFGLDSPPHRFDDDEEIAPPKVIRAVNPDTDSALRRKVQGDVVVEVLVLRDGSVRSVRVLRGLEKELDERALEAAKEWRFEPARLDGEPVDVIAEMVVSFKVLEERP